MTQEKTFFSFKREEPVRRKKRRPKRLRAAARPPLTIAQILEWADAHKQRTGAWPSHNSGAVAGAGGELWARVDKALRMGRRGLPGDSSIAQLLSVHRGRRNQKRLPCLALEQILGWADAHRNATGSWPTIH